jgi:mannose-1-phosphate guanylyltransferase
MLHAIILAGGSGTRLWPASRTAKPKHLLSFEPPKTLLQATLERLTDLVPPERTWIVTSQAQSTQVANSLPQFNVQHILSEPVPRNTAISIGWAAVKLRRIDPDAVMIVLPADHMIKPDSVFCKTLQRAADIVLQSPDTLCTLGIKPTFPATSYGYIQRGTAVKGTNNAYHVLRFCEKPKQEIAETFFQSGDFYWNAGIFVWKAETILKLLDQFEPEIGCGLRRMEQSLGTPDETRVTDNVFNSIKSLSIDYVVMERAKEIVVVESTFDWNDVGTWSALDRLYADQMDQHGNLSIASQMLSIDSTNCTVRCEDSKHLVALVGMHDVVVIQTADATLIARKDQEESVRRIVEELKKQNRNEWS